MKTPKVTIDRPPISTEEILARKNFKSLHSAYQQQIHVSFKERMMEALMKNRLNFMSSVAGVTTVGVVIVAQMNRTETPPTLASATIETPAVSVIQALDTQITQTENILVPENVSDEITNEETISYSTASEVAIVAPVESENIHKRTDSLQALILKEKSEIAQLENAISALETTMPIKPEKPKGYRFTMDIDPGEFPKISKFKNVLFEVAADETSFSPEFMKMEWDKGKITKDDNGKFKLTLTKDKKTFSFKVFQVQEEKTNTASQKEYNAQQRTMDSLSGLKTKKTAYLNQLEAQKN